jgi:predicted nucleotidyltransferase
MDFVHPVEAVIPGAQGRVLSVLVETTAELNLRTIARLAGVSVAQASRVLPELVELGIVERREVPPSSLFRLERAHVAARALVDLARSRDAALDSMGAAAKSMPVVPVSVIVFGSFARGEAGAQSDIDAVVVRPVDVHDDDEAWATSLEDWRSKVRAMTGNSVEVLDVDRLEARSRLASKSRLWRDIVRDGVVVHGLSPVELSAPIHA